MGDIAFDVNSDERWLPEHERLRREALRRPPILKYVGVDLGAASDYTAIAAVEYRTATETCNLIGLERMRYVPYIAANDGPSVVKRVCEIMALPQLEGAELLVDYTGVGRPVFEAFRAAGLKPIGISITAGNNVNGSPAGYNVPKKHLVFALLALFQGGRFAIANDIPTKQALVNELQNFAMKIKAGSTHDSYEAWREADHDDLTLACALVAWRISFQFRPKGNQKASMRRLYG